MPSRSLSPAAQVLAALVIGLALGLAAAFSSDPALVAAAEWIEPVGVIWVNAIRMTVIPLVVSLLVTGIAERSGVGVGRLGARSFTVFLGLLGVAAVYSLLVVTWSMHWLVIDPVTSAALRASVTATAAETTSAINSAPGFRDWLIGLVPTNPIQAAVQGALLPLIVFTLLFALALSRLEPGRSAPVLRVFRAIADALLVLVRWIIVLAPIGVLALIMPASARLGASAVGALGYYLVAVLLLSTGLLLLLYPVVALVTGTPIARFAKAVLPGQAVAFGTRSSLAALPALIEGADRVLGMSASVRGFALPLAASTFKIASPVSKVAGALFLAKLYGVHIGLTQVLTLVAVSILLSASTPGVPHSWLIILAPMLAAVGIPPEGIGLLMAVDVIPDMIFTTLNATGYMAAAAIVAGRPEPVAEKG